MTLALSHGTIQRYGGGKACIVPHLSKLVTHTMLDVIAVITTKVTSRGAGTVQMREASDSGIRNCEEM